MRFAFLLMAALVANQASAWWGKGHLVVARIAYDFLEEGNAEVVIRDVDELLMVLKKSDPRITFHEGKYPMVECATFAD